MTIRQRSWTIRSKSGTSSSRVSRVGLGEPNFLHEGVTSPPGPLLMDANSRWFESSSEPGDVSVAATYHQVWWPSTETVKFDGGHLPVWGRAHQHLPRPAHRRSAPCVGPGARRHRQSGRAAARGPVRRSVRRPGRARRAQGRQPVHRLPHQVPDQARRRLPPRCHRRPGRARRGPVRWSAATDSRPASGQSCSASAGRLPTASPARAIFPPNGLAVACTSCRPSSANSSRRKARQHEGPCIQARKDVGPLGRTSQSGDGRSGTSRPTRILRGRRCTALDCNPNCNHARRWDAHAGHLSRRATPAYAGPLPDIAHAGRAALPVPDGCPAGCTACGWRGWAWLARMAPAMVPGGGYGAQGPHGVRCERPCPVLSPPSVRGS